MVRQRQRINVLARSSGLNASVSAGRGWLDVSTRNFKVLRLCIVLANVTPTCLTTLGLTYQNGVGQVSR